MKDFWKHIPHEYHAQIREMALSFSRKKNETLFLEGRPYKGFYIVESGSFRIYKGNEAGDEATISIAHAGDLIAAVPMITGESSYHADCISLEASRILFLPARPFHHLMMQKPVLMMEFSKLLLAYALEIRTKYLNLMLKDASHRFLEFLKKNEKGRDYFGLPVSKKNIAHLLDLTPESLSRVISKLEKENKISIQGKKFKLLTKT